jgi:hypothetical protein
MTGMEIPVRPKRLYFIAGRIGLIAAWSNLPRDIGPIAPETVRCGAILLGLQRTAWMT